MIVKRCIIKFGAEVVIVTQSQLLIIRGKTHEQTQFTSITTKSQMGKAEEPEP
ncbi:hypothetical protein [Vallitalea guaymasensis]|uniref:hypothetical protein n=1 Tax=Vallitalea guaymasensis TaxID=1185412 RepID=UPI00235462B9|nr:hypothetical protein [Vallitalea guaymasensis]